MNYAILPFFVGLTVCLTLIILQVGIGNVTSGLDLYVFLVGLTVVLFFVRRYVNRKYREAEWQLERLISLCRAQDQKSKSSQTARPAKKKRRVKR